MSKIIYKIEVESFKDRKVYYYSDLELAKEHLPKLESFRQIIQWHMPNYTSNGNYHKNPDYKHNEKIEIVLELGGTHNHPRFEIIAKNVKFFNTYIEKIDEVKIEGQAYVPASEVKTDLPDTYEDRHIAYAYIKELKLDELSDER